MVVEVVFNPSIGADMLIIGLIVSSLIVLVPVEPEFPLVSVPVPFR